MVPVLRSNTGRSRGWGREEFSCGRFVGQGGSSAPLPADHSSSCSRARARRARSPPQEASPPQPESPPNSPGLSAHPPAARSSRSRPYHAVPAKRSRACSTWKCCGVGLRRAADARLPLRGLGSLSEEVLFSQRGPEVSTMNYACLKTYRPLGPKFSTRPRRNRSTVHLRYD